MKYIICAITDWEKDEYAMMGDSGHISDGDIKRKELEEYEQKVENNEWPGLPFKCEADSEEDAVDQYNEACCGGDYYKATEAEFEE